MNGNSPLERGLGAHSGRTAVGKTPPASKEIGESLGGPVTQAERVRRVAVLGSSISLIVRLTGDGLPYTRVL